jgi:hypothetical protein
MLLLVDLVYVVGCWSFRIVIELKRFEIKVFIHIQERMFVFRLLLDY